MSRAESDEFIAGVAGLSVGYDGRPAPDGWTWVKLTDAAKLESGHTPSRKHPEYWGGTVPWISIPDARIHHGRVIVATEQTVTEEGLANSAARWLPKDTVCLSRTASVGYVIRLGRPMATSQDFVNWICGPAVDPSYLMYALMAEGKHIREFGKGSTHTTIYFPAVLAFHLALPPLAEQRRIVAKIEVLLTQVHAVKDQLARVPPILKRLRQSVLAAACSGKLTEEWRSQRGAVLPWDRRPIGAICGIVGGSQPAKDHFIYEPRNGYVRLVQIRDYKSDDHVTFVPRTLAKRFCISTDVMIGRYGPPLFQILRGLEGAYNVALMKAVPRTEYVEGNFLFYLLQDPPLRDFIIHGSERTVGQDGVKRDLLEGYEVGVPPLDEQGEIVRRIETCFFKLDEIEQQFTLANRLADRLTQTILAKAFRGELVPTEAELALTEGRDYETATQLMARVRSYVPSNETSGKRSAKKRLRSAEPVRASRRA